jgi:hypothetical protein
MEYKSSETSDKQIILILIPSKRRNKLSSSAIDDLFDFSPPSFPLLSRIFTLKLLAIPCQYISIYSLKFEFAFTHKMNRNRSSTDEEFFSLFIQNSYHSLHGVVIMLNHMDFVLSDPSGHQVSFITNFTI